MTDDVALQHRLMSAVRRTLLPHSFPPRRDIELAGSISPSSSGSTLFYDYLWPRPGCLALLAARVAGDTIEATLQAAGLRHLLRATLRTEADPSRAIELCRNISGQPPWDVAVAVFDPATGDVKSATHGVAIAAPVGGHNQSPEIKDLRLATGSSFWLAAGIPTLPVSMIASTDPKSLIDGAASTVNHAAIAVISYKMPTRQARHETLSLSNDLSEIPQVIVAFEEFCSRQGIAEGAVQGVNVALDEILTNVVSYAFKDGAAHEICVDLQADDQRLTIDVKDDGRPFNPLKAAAPELSGGIDHRVVGGLGVHFVRSILDEVRYRRVDGWNVLTLEKATTSVPKK
jgi:anti-sigma regulatory factor (Ser/Thr protein kinase)